MNSFVAHSLFHVELNGIAASIEIILDENATEFTIDYVNVDPDDYTAERTGSYLTISQAKPRDPLSHEYLDVRARRQARTAAAEKNTVPIRQQMNYPNLIEADAAPSIIITTHTVHFGIHNCQDVSGTVGGELNISAFNNDYVGIAGAGNVGVIAKDSSVVALTNVRGNLSLDASDRATITTDSAPGDIQVTASEDATVKVI